MVRRRPLGKTGLEVSELGFGCSSFWAKTVFPEHRALGLVHAAIERGVNFFDTGWNYAAGQAERRLGEALREHRSKEIVVSTKAGTRVSATGSTYKDFRPTWLRESVEGSLKNLQLDHLTILNLHVPEPEDVTDDVLECLERMRDAGLVRYCGLHGSDVRLHPLVLKHDILTTAMYDYNIFRVDRGVHIDELAASDKVFLGATPLAQALFSNKIFKPRRLADLWYLARALKNHRHDVRRGFAFRFINQFEGWTGAEIALAYALSNRNVSVAIFGTTSMDRLCENLAVSGRELPREIIARIEAA